MDIQLVKTKFDLLKKATLQKEILVKDLAKELKESITDVMQYILDNPKLFVTKEVWSYKTKPHYYYVCGTKCKETVQVKDKLKGLGVQYVYLTAEDNFRTEEWLKKQEIIYSKTIWVSKWNNYGYIEGEYVAEDIQNNDDHHYHLWRNTSNKIEELTKLGVFVEKTFYIGGFGDCSSHKCKTAITEAGKELAIKNGWTIIE